jgi:hypothetical protein
VVLTLEASEIAADSGDRERGRSWKEMKERLLFNGIHIEGDRTAKDKGKKLTFVVLPHSAEAPF